MPEAGHTGEQQAKPAPGPFSVMAKPAGSRCNLACGYCYYLKAERPDQARMTDELLERFVRQYIEASGGPEVGFVWHGGEPTLAGLDFYRRAVELQSRYLPEGWRCWNNLQTNGILLDDEWCAFLEGARFDVGLSIDGTESLHDRYRKDLGGKGTYPAVSDAVRRLRAHGIRPDLLCAVTADAAKEPLEVYRALRELDTGWIQFIPIVRKGADGGLTPDSVTGEGYGDFLCAAFDEWALHDLGRLDVQLFAETARVWAGGGAGLCWMAPTCGRALIVEMDGGVYACDHYVDAEHRIGDIAASHLGELADSQAQRRFGEAKRRRLPARCRRCEWLAACGGGCPKDRFAASREGKHNLNILCNGLSRFYAHARPAMEEIIRRTGRGQSPAAIMDALRARELAKWRSVGRTIPAPVGAAKRPRLAAGRTARCNGKQ